jgi:hypothetical protein
VRRPEGITDAGYLDQLAELLAELAPMEAAMRNDDTVGDNELFQLLSKPSPEVLRIHEAIVEGLGSEVRAPVAIAALTFVLAEAIVANTSPPQQWAEVVGVSLREFVAVAGRAGIARTS